MLEVRLLGKFEVNYKKKPISIASRPAQSLFAYLILSAGTFHRREKLAGLLWPDSPEETARDNLRHALWRLRKALESASSIRFLHADDLTIKFQETSEYWLDAAELEKMSEGASADELMAVLSNYHGELLQGFYDEWVVLEREHLNSIFEHKMSRLMSLLQDEKRWPAILDWGERWIKLGQKPELAYRALMSAHAAKGDMSKVAVTYERCVKSLKEFGVEPSEQTRILYERLKAGKEKYGEEPVFTTSSIPSPITQARTNLPNPITSFMGREKEIQEVVKLLETNRLITLTGPGGVGKTRLAIQSSKQVVNEYKDGVWWVELASILDETLVTPAVAQVLGVRESPGEPLMESVKVFLREKQLLLILDNCEHLINVCAQFSHDLLTQSANLRIMTTSREALNVMGESEYQVHPLSLPMSDRRTFLDLLLEYEGIRLFLERASAVKRDLALTQQNGAMVLQICERLDGIPLALELAAARVKILSLEEIATRLDNRFALLTHGSRTALPRHQTLRAAIDWSYDLLSDKELILFRRLAVFAGGWTLQTAQTICSANNIGEDEILYLLEHLVDKSLVIVQTQNGETRYKFLETIRQYAYEKFIESSEAERVGKRHLEYFVQLAEEADTKVNGPGSAAWLDRLEREHDNLRIALGWALEHNDMELASRIGTALFWFWQLRSHMSEGSQWLEQIIQLGRQQSKIEPMSSRVMTLFACTLNHAGILAGFQGVFTVGRSRSEEGLELSRKIENKRLVSQALSTLGYIMIQQGDYAAVAEVLHESLALTRELGDKLEEWRALMRLGTLTFIQQDYASAQTYNEEGLAIARELGNKQSEAVFIGNLGHVALNQHNYTAAREHYTESLLLFRDIGSKRHMLADITGFAALAQVLGKFESATRLSGAIETLYDSIGSSLDPDEQVVHERTLSESRAQLDEVTFNQWFSEGSAMTLEQAIEFALEETKEWKL